MWSTYNSPIFANNKEDAREFLSDLTNILEHLQYSNCTLKDQIKKFLLTLLHPENR